MNINLGPKLFSFSSFTDWLNHAQSKFAQAGASSRNIVCVDQKGRICALGGHFMTARDEDAFPVDAYLIRPTK